MGLPYFLRIGNLIWYNRWYNTYISFLCAFLIFLSFKINDFIKYKSLGTIENSMFPRLIYVGAPQGTRTPNLRIRSAKKNGYFPTV